ncbi:hypothetical protein ACEPAI_1816 [Sanghuangporus weigelae]
MQGLPPEIICDIFKCSLPARISAGNILYDESVRAPLLISHVCSSWRSLALSTGELWCQLCIDYESSEREKRRKMMLEVFQTWLLRSKSCPLNYLFYCDLGEEEDIEVHHYAERIMTMFLAEQHRWADVHFSCNEVQLSPEFPGIVLTDMPILTSLSLSSEIETMSRRPLINVTKSSRLKSLRLYGNYDLELGTKPFFALTEPSKLEFSSNVPRCFDTFSIICFLRNAPFLSEFHVDSFCTWDDLPPGPTNHTPLLLHELRALKLGGHYAAEYVLERVTLPYLTALLYEDDSYGPGDRSLLNFFERSRPPLTFLEIRGIDLFEDTATILQSLPGLMDLRIKHTIISIQLFHTLTIKEDRQVTCPALSSLWLEELDLTSTRSAGIEALISMVKSRQGSLVPFRTGCVDYGIGEQNAREFEVAEIDKKSDLLLIAISDAAIKFKGDEIPPYPFRKWDELDD